MTRRLLGSPENQPVPAMNRWPVMKSRNGRAFHWYQGFLSTHTRPGAWLEKSWKSAWSAFLEKSRRRRLNKILDIFWRCKTDFFRLGIEIRSSIVDRRERKIVHLTARKNRDRARQWIIHPRCQSIACQRELSISAKSEATRSDGDDVANTPRRARRRTAWPRWPRRVTSRHRASRSAQPPPCRRPQKSASIPCIALRRAMCDRRAF